MTGPSGCGKTSLLRTMAGLWSIGSGKITFYVNDGTNLQSNISSEFNPVQVNNASDKRETKPIFSSSRCIFFLPQRPYMVLGTLRQQLLYPTWADDVIFMSDGTTPISLCFKK